MHIIPAVNASTEAEAEQQIAKVAGFAHWIHIDVVDGKFTSPKTWGSASEFKNLLEKNPHLKNINFEIHLMVENPDFVIEEWIHAGAMRVIVHVEAMKNASKILSVCQSGGVEAMLAINPKTQTENLSLHLDTFKYFGLHDGVEHYRSIGKGCGDERAISRDVLQCTIDRSECITHSYQCTSNCGAGGTCDENTTGACAGEGGT